MLFKQDILRLSSVNSLSKTKKKAMLSTIDELGDRMPSLLDIDHPCAQRQIMEARHTVEVYIPLYDQVDCCSLPMLFLNYILTISVHEKRCLFLLFSFLISFVSIMCTFSAVNTRTR